MKQIKKICVTGGCGYVGSVLVRKLAMKYPVIAFDSMIFGNHISPIENVEFVQGDIRDNMTLKSVLTGCTDVIHLAAIANDPTSDLDPAITYSVNREAIKALVKIAKQQGVSRFINASSSSVYGVKQEESVTEELSLEPITLYAKLKAEGEEIVGGASSPDFTTVSIRSATVCGVSPRMRFDVIVNILARDAVVKKEITVFGGNQHRPNIHIDDITDVYSMLIEVPANKINGKVYNVGSNNYTVIELAEMAHEETGAKIIVDPNTTDNRSYRISSETIKQELGYTPKKEIRQAIRDIMDAFNQGVFSNPDDSIYYNIKVMKEKLAK